MKCMYNKRFLAALLATILTCGSFIGCTTDPAADTSKDSVHPDTAETDPTSGTEEELEYQKMTFLERIRSANAEIPDGLPEYNGEDSTFIIGGLTSYGVSYFDEEGLIGESLNDAKFYQMLSIEERFGFRFELQARTSADYLEALNAFKQLVMAQDTSSMHLYRIWNTSSAELVASGSFHELSGLENIDTSKPWYFEDEMKSYGLKGKYWVATGFMDASDVVNNVACIFFNKDLAEQYSISDDFYQVVRDGKWTLDYFYNIMSSFYHDADGDGQRSNDDIYGGHMGAYPLSIYFLPCLDVPQMYLENDEAKFTVFENAEQAEKVWNKLKGIYKDPAQIEVHWNKDEYELIPSWEKGRALFYTEKIGEVETMRDYNFEIGILPVFKLDETQQDYYSNYLPNPFAIPSFVENPEISALVMSAMAAEGYKQVLPVAYEKVIKFKYANDEDSGEMIDLMMKNVKGDAMFAYGDSMYIYNLMFYICDDTAEFASYWAQKRSSVENRAEEYYQMYEKLIK